MSISTAAIYPPSSMESKYYYYGLPSQPRLVARSSPNVWVEPSGFEAYLSPKETSPVGLHPLCNVWEAAVGPAIIDYLGRKAVEWTSLDPVRIGDAGAPSPPVIVWIGVVPNTLSPQDGVEVATGCKAILSAHKMDDVHVEIRESLVVRSAGPKMYKPVHTFYGTAEVQEPFSTSLGLPISPEKNPSIAGTGGFFLSDQNKPGKIFLVTARHVLFGEEESNVHFHWNVNHPKRNVLLFSDDDFKKHTTAIPAAISGKHVLIAQLERRLECSRQLDEKDLAAELRRIEYQSVKAEQVIEDLKNFNAEISRGWKKREDRKLGFVVVSPPLALNVGEEGFTEDWALVEIDSSKIDSTNFVGNAIDLGTSIPLEKFSVWMYPHRRRDMENPFSSFEYPSDRLLKISGTIPDKEMWKLSQRTVNHHGDPCIMVIKRGNTSGLTVGRLNNIRSFTRYYVGVGDAISKEVVILPRDSKSGTFSVRGDSGSAVIDGEGRLAGLITAGSGVSEDFDCTYVMSINFLLQRMHEMHIKPNLFPVLT